MNITIKTTTEAKDAADFIAQAIIHQLELNKKVLYFVTGGSSIAVAHESSKIISKHPHQNLVVMMTDERYGPLDHPNSNWHQLLEKGFSLPQAKLIPILTGEDRIITNKKFNAALEHELSAAEYKIGLFGIGADGHTAGILPKSVAVNAQEWSTTYDTEKFERITITPKTIERLDEIIVFMQGEEKWSVIENLEKNNLDIFEQPAQILKKVPLLTIFTDKKI